MSEDRPKLRDCELVETAYVPRGSTRCIEVMSRYITLDDGSWMAPVKLGRPEKDGTWERVVTDPRTLHQHSTTNLLFSLLRGGLLYHRSRLLIYRGEEQGWLAAGWNRQGEQVELKAGQLGPDDEAPNLTRMLHRMMHDEPGPWRDRTPKNDAADVDLEDDADEGEV